MMNFDAFDEFTSLRIDGRRPGEMREVMFEFGIIAAADGSGRCLMGLTEALAVVRGPVTGKNPGDPCDVRVMIRDLGLGKRRTDPGDRRRRDDEHFLYCVLDRVIRKELYVGSEIHVNAVILHDDGSGAVGAVNAACLALIDAGIQMKDTFAAISVAVVGSTLMVDAGQGEARFPRLDVVILPSTRKIAALRSLQKLTPAELDEATRVGVEAGQCLYERLATAVRG